MVAAMRRNDQPRRTPAFGETGGDGEHDAVAERHHRLFHGRRLVMPVGNLTSRPEQRGGKEPVHKVERDHLVRHPEDVRVLGGEGNFAVIVLCAIIEAQHGRDFMVPVRPVERRHRIHAARTKHHDLHVAYWLSVVSYPSGPADRLERQ